MAVSLIFLVFFLGSCYQSLTPQRGNQEAHFVAATGSRLSWTFAGLPLSDSPWFTQFPCETHLLTWLSLAARLAALVIVRVLCRCSTHHTITPSPSRHSRCHQLDAPVPRWPLRSLLPSGSDCGCLLVPIIWSELAEASTRKQAADYCDYYCSFN